MITKVVKLLLNQVLLQTDSIHHKTNENLLIYDIDHSNDIKFNRSQVQKNMSICYEHSLNIVIKLEL